MITLTKTIQKRFHKTWIGIKREDKHIEVVRVTTLRILVIPVFVYVKVLETNM